MCVSIPAPNNTKFETLHPVTTASINPNLKTENLPWLKCMCFLMFRLEATSSYIPKTLLFSVWNGQVLFTFLTCMTSQHFMSLVTRIWTWHLEILPPCPTCSSLCLDFTCWSPLWFSSICSLLWCQTHIRGFSNNLMWSGSLVLPSWSDQCTEQTCRHPQSIWSPHGLCISSECARKVSYIQFHVLCFLILFCTYHRQKI